MSKRRNRGGPVKGRRYVALDDGTVFELPKFLTNTVDRAMRKGFATSSTGHGGSKPGSFVKCRDRG